MSKYIPPPPQDWTKEINELESFFKTCTFPAQIKLHEWEVITNVQLCIKSHIGTLRANNGKYYFRPYMTRLRELKALMNTPC